MSRLARILVGLLLLFLAAGALFLERARHAASRSLANAQQAWRALAAQTRLLDEAQQVRVQYLQKRYLLDFPKKYVWAFSELIRRLSLFAGQGICLTRLEAQPENQSCRLLFEIQVRDASQARRSRSWRLFFQRLKGLEEELPVVFSTEGPQTGPLYHLTGTLEIE